MKRTTKSEAKQETGASIVEYALLLVLIAVAVVGVLQVLSDETSQTFSRSASAISEANG